MKSKVETMTIEILNSTESSLRELLIEQGKDASIDDLTWLTYVINRIRSVQTYANNRPEEYSQRRPSTDRPTVSRKAGQDSVAKQSSTDKAQYPIFHLENEVLIKRGWSKKQNAEYVQMVPRYQCNAVFDELKTRGANQSFNTTEFVTFMKEEPQHAVPAYVSYVTMQWLRKQGLLLKLGKSDHRVVGKWFDFDRYWKELPER